MKTPATDEITTLLEYRGPCASLYMPFHPGKRELRGDLLVLKNQLDEAERNLTALGVRSSDARDWLQPAARLIEDMGFWQKPGQGVALFISKEGMRSYHLPFPVREWCVIARRFHCKPLIAGLSHNQHFFVLAVSQNQVRLLRCTMYGHDPVELPADTPKSLSDFLIFDVLPNVGKVHHPAPVPDPSRRAGGSGPDPIPDRKDQILLFFRHVDEHVLHVLREDRSPMVLAGDEAMVSLYRQATHYPSVMDEAVLGSPDRVADMQLVEKARDIIRPRYDRVRNAAAERLGAALGRGLGSTDLKDVLIAAAQGRVATLFLKNNGSRWGIFDPGNGDMQLRTDPQPGDEDLLDLAAANTHLSRGTIFIDENTPRNSDAAAEFRY